LFSALTFTFDTEAGTRKIARDKARREAQEKGKLRLEKWELTNDLTRQTREDSIARSQQAFRSDSLAEMMANKARTDSSQMANKAAQDSAQMAGKATQDSLALLDSQRKLAEEKSKRSEAEKQLLSTGMLLMDAVYFETNKTDISINSKPYLNIIAKMLTKYPKLQIEVSGHTDAMGSDTHNMMLSQGRAQAVGAYMESAASELRGMLTAKGYGETQPKSDNATAAGRKLNRRTELQVLNKEVLKEYNP
jgi:outer membrane protein OmpA-like peptidoglycan-associated protein